MQHGIPEVNN